LLVARQGSITASQLELTATLERLLRKGGALGEERTEG